MRNLIAVLALALALTSCSHNLREEFDTSLSKYNDLLSRNELGAANRYAANSIREESINRAAALKDERIVDYKIINIRYAEEKHRASVDVEISYYNLYHNKVKSLQDIEEWTYSEENGAKGWRITSVLPEFK